MSDLSRIRESGHRLTPQRKAVLEAVEKLRHGTPDEIYAEVRRTHDSVNLSTVYRTLELLNELGVIRHVHLSGRVPTYHSMTGHEHAHLICRSCGTSVSVGRDQLDLARLEEETGFVVDFGHLAVFGTCAACADRSPRTP